MAIPPPIPVDMTMSTHIFDSVEFKYQDALADVIKAEDEACFPPCPGCGKQVMALSMDPDSKDEMGKSCLTSEYRVCECGYEFWKKYTRYDLAQGSL